MSISGARMEKIVLEEIEATEKRYEHYYDLLKTAISGILELEENNEIQTIPIQQKINTTLTRISQEMALNMTKEKTE